MGHISPILPFQTSQQAPALNLLPRPANPATFNNPFLLELARATARNTTTSSSHTEGTGPTRLPTFIPQAAASPACSGTTQKRASSDRKKDKKKTASSMDGIPYRR